MMTTRTATLVLADKLDAKVRNSLAAVNGPRGLDLEWDAILWRPVEDEVRRLRQRIFKASQEGNLKKVRNLQKLMLRSRANTLVSVRRVTELNAGRKTAGVDGEVVLTSRAKTVLVDEVHRDRKDWRARPVKRVYIPKANGKQRPLGIPVLRDRCQQARVVNALEPEWEARFEPRSYGFRPGRGCHDAIQAIYLTARGKNPLRQWVLDADLTAAFDRINHQRLLASLGTFPGRVAVAGWMAAGVIEQGRLSPTVEGTPQGGVISPLLLNIALHGMEEAAGVRYLRCDPRGAQVAGTSPALARYADDLVVLCHSRDQAEQTRQRLAEWLAPRGLTFNQDKTRIVHLSEGFDFLGFNVRRYGTKLLIKPSPTAVKRMRQRIRTEVHSLRGANADAMIRRLNPIIRGWAAYYRGVVSKEVFASLDHYLWGHLYRWALRAHPRKSKHWVVTRYFDVFNQSRQDRWVFGDRDSGRYLRRFVWTKIVRHSVVMGTASPDDPNLVRYWAGRRRKMTDWFGGQTATALRRQHGRCPVCDTFLLHADHGPESPTDYESWIRTITKALRRNALVRHVGQDGQHDQTPRLLHTHCHKAQRCSGASTNTNGKTPLRLA